MAWKYFEYHMDIFMIQNDSCDDRPLAKALMMSA